MTANKKGFTTKDMLRVDCLAYIAEQKYKEKSKGEKIIPLGKHKRGERGNE